MWYLLLVASVLCLAHSKMKLCLFASYTYKRKSIRVFRTPILVYLDVRGVEIPLLSTVSISNCRYQEAPGEVVWSDFLAQLPRRSIEILWHLTRPSGLVKCQRISILLLGNCARISQTGQTFKLDFSGHVCRVAFALIEMFFFYLLWRHRATHRLS